MNLKTVIYILGVTLLSTFVSCLGDEDEIELVYSSDAQITSFSIKNDTIKKYKGVNLSAIMFSIDQMGNKIFNRDSADYGLVINDKVVVTYTTASSFNLLNVTGEDTVIVKSGDSIDIRKPLKLLSYAQNGDKKEYAISFNIYQVDPDSICWKQVNSDLDLSVWRESKTFIFNDVFYCFARYNLPEYMGGMGESMHPIALYISSDAAMSWDDRISNINSPLFTVLSQMQQFGEELYVCTYYDKDVLGYNGDLYKANISDNFTSWTPVLSDYPVKSIFGTLPEKEVLVLAVEKDGSIVSATFDGENWEYGDKLPDALPTQDFSILSYTRTNAGYLTIAGGTSGTTWGTTNGLYWAKIGDLPSNMQGANVFVYNDKFYLLNGMANTYNQSVYTSMDGAITWQKAPIKTNFPEDYTFRTRASVIVDSDDIIYIIGGKNGDNPVTDIWRGRLNRLNR